MGKSSILSVSTSDFFSASGRQILAMEENILEPVSLASGAGFSPGDFSACSPCIWCRVLPRSRI